MKKLFLTICSLVLTPMFSAKANSGDHEVILLKSGCYQLVTSEDGNTLLCSDENIEIIPVRDEDIERANKTDDIQPTTLSLEEK